MFEGGGACWEQNACQMKGGLLGATNYNGIPTNYMSTGLALGGLITPFTSRTHPLQKVQTQSWNIVYVPYCTGDVHTGNKVATYGDADPANPITYYHRGFKNGEAVANWVGRYLPKQDQLLVTGFSAGGVGATAMYGLIRLPISPNRRRCWPIRGRCSRWTAMPRLRMRLPCCCTTRSAWPGAWMATTVWLPA